MCLYPLVKFACCDMQYKPDIPLPIVKFCARGHPDTIRESFPGCEAREAHECNDFFRLPIKCPKHKLQWLTEMDLNSECQKTDRQLRDAGVSGDLRFRYRDKMGRAFEMLSKCADRMEAERLQAWKVKMFCTGAALELLGTAIVGSDARPLDYSVLQNLRERLVKHINGEALQLKEDATRRASCPRQQQQVDEQEQDLVHGHRPIGAPGSPPSLADAELDDRYREVVVVPDDGPGLGTIEAILPQQQQQPPLCGLPSSLGLLSSPPPAPLHLESLHTFPALTMPASFHSLFSGLASQQHSTDPSPFLVGAHPLATFGPPFDFAAFSAGQEDLAAGAPFSQPRGGRTRRMSATGLIPDRDGAADVLVAEDAVDLDMGLCFAPAMLLHDGAEE